LSLTFKVIQGRWYSFHLKSVRTTLCISSD